MLLALVSKRRKQEGQAPLNAEGASANDGPPCTNGDQSDAERLRGALEGSQGIVPPQLQQFALRDGDPPAVFVDSAEALTAYRGFNGDKKSAGARARTEKKLQEQINRYGLAREQERADPGDPGKDIGD